MNSISWEAIKKYIGLHKQLKIEITYDLNSIRLLLIKHPYEEKDGKGRGRQSIERMIAIEELESSKFNVLEFRLREMSEILDG